MSHPARAAAAEFLGSAGLAAVVVGSGIAAQRLSPADVGLQLLENAVATALGLAVLILVFATVSGSHFNPVVTLVDVALRRRPWATVALYLPMQVLGCIAGAILANVMFAAPAVAWSATDRSGWPVLLAEVVATAGLIVVIFALAQTGRSHLTAPAVGAYIGAAYFFTSSTAFANPAITIGRMFTDTFAGIAPASALPFIGAELVGAAVGLVVVRLLFPPAVPTSGPAAGCPEPSGSTREPTPTDQSHSVDSGFSAPANGASRVSNSARSPRSTTVAE